VKIASFNINNVNRRLPNLLAWLKSTKPDLVCLQELKAEQANFPAHAISILPNLRSGSSTGRCT
jgi:exodeoxyribonuclease-3